MGIVIGETKRLFNLVYKIVLSLNYSKPFYLKWIILLIAIGFILFFGSNILALSLNLLDFNNYLLGSKIILNGKSPYGVVEFFAPPWMILIIGIFLPFPNQIASFIWLLLCVCSVFGIVVISINWVDSESLKHHKGLILSIFGLMPASLFCYITGQIAPLVSFAIVYIAYSLTKKTVSPWIVFMGLLIVTLKPHIALLPVIIYTFELIKNRNWKFLKFISIGFFIVSLLALTVNHHWIQDMISAWQSGDYRGGKPGLLSPGYIGLYELGIPSWIFVFFVGYVIYKWRKHGITYYTFSLALSINLLSIPYCRCYDYTMLILPGIYLLSNKNKNCYIGITLALLSLFLIPITALSVLSPVIMTIGLLLCNKTNNLNQESLTFSNFA